MRRPIIDGALRSHGPVRRVLSWSLGLLTGGGLFVAGFYAIEVRRQAQAARGWSVPGGTSGEPERLDFRAGGVVLPDVVPAGGAGLRDEEEVLGVVVDGEARAYRLSAMRTEVTHIINDRIGGVPVSVTYCDLADCYRGFTAESPATGTLDLAQAGILDGRMILESAGFEYFQDDGRPVDRASPPLPYRELPLTRTTWKEWRTRHPGSGQVIDLGR